MSEEQTGQASSAKQVNIGSWVSKSWELVTANIGPFLLLGLIYLAIIIIASSTAIGVLFVMGPLTVGFFIVILNKMRGGELKIGDIAQGFNFFVAAVLSSILVSLFTMVGTVFCIIPGIIVEAFYLFVSLFIIEKKLDFWEAMEASRKAAKPHIFELCLFVIVLALINLAGVLACGVGVLFTLPLTFSAIAYAYDDLVGMNKEA